MSGSFLPPRPATPQAVLHRLPDKSLTSETLGQKPSKYIILITGSTAVAGKLQIAKSVADGLSCPWYQGDSLHDSSAKAASVGGGGGGGGSLTSSMPNEARYQRMWLSKLTRTGLLFPEESKPANAGFTGFGGTSSSTTSRRGSASSIASHASSFEPPSSSVGTSRTSQDEEASGRQSLGSSTLPTPPRISATMSGSAAWMASSSSSNTVFTLPEAERLRRENPVLMVLTHPELIAWHKKAIRAAVGDYDIGVLFVPLYEDVEVDEGEEEFELPVLQPLDPTLMKSFPVFSKREPEEQTRPWDGLSRELKLHIDVSADVQGIIDQIIEGVKDVIDTRG